MKKKQPIITLDRLILRPVALADAFKLAELANFEEVALQTRLPYPYTVEHAKEWISNLDWLYKNDHFASFAITLKDTGEFMGTISVGVKRKRQLAELGYWLGMQYWGNGYATEAALAMFDFVFTEMRIDNIYSTVSIDNPGSQRVVQKLGMKKTRLLKDHKESYGRTMSLLIYEKDRQSYLKEKKS